MNAIPFSDDFEAYALKPTKTPSLRVLGGGLVLGRVSNISIDESDFRNSNAIVRMSATKVAKQVAYRIVDHKRQEYTVKEQREPSTPSEIVKVVVSKTHRDLGETVLSTVFSQIDTEYDSFNYEVQKNSPTTITQATAEQSTQYAKTDLIRGMDAFTEATQEHWGSLYDDTVLRPANTFARWLIIVESEAV